MTEYNEAQDEYLFVLDDGEWLEDKGGQFSRYDYMGSNQEWVCHHCETVINCDPIEHDCPQHEH